MAHKLIPLCVCLFAVTSLALKNPRMNNNLVAEKLLPSLLVDLLRYQEIGPAIKFPIIPGTPQFQNPSSVGQAPGVVVESTINQERESERVQAAITSPEDEEFDYVIIGGGTSGSILARRLAENGRNSILLLEAGGSPTQLHAIPSAALGLIPIKATSFDYKTISQEHACKAMDEHACPIWAGKILGGSSSIGLNMYMRGAPEFYDKWAEMTGSDSYNYENMLPFLKKCQTYHGFWRYSPKYHGSSGHIHVSDFDYHPGMDHWLNAGKELKYKIKDYNEEDDEVFSPIDTMAKNGKRINTYSAYIESHPNMNNLVIRRFAKATRIRIDKKNIAKSITYDHVDTIKSVKAKKEIIVCAGVYNSPKLLILSGVGPKEELKEHEITLHADLPVGLNLIEPIYVPFGPFVKGPVFDPKNDVNTDSTIQYYSNGTGPLAFPSYVGMAYMKTMEASHHNILITTFPIKMDETVSSDLTEYIPIKHETMEKFLKPFSGKSTQIVWVTLTSPNSRGSVSLSSKDHQAVPLIDPQFLSNPTDVAQLVEALNRTLDIFEKTKAYNVRINNQHMTFPLCAKHSFRTKEYYECYIRNMAMGRLSGVGTCPMGNDGSGVVDSEFRVKGIKHLRVVDASVIPLPEGSPQATVMALAEKAAEFILSEDSMHKKHPLHNE